MPIRPDIVQCTHIKLNGYRCGSPALSGRPWCYFHARMRRGAKARLDAAIPSLLLLEDAESIQGALMQIIDMLLLDQIEVKKARLIIHAIEVASRNVRNLHLGQHPWPARDYGHFDTNMVHDLVEVEELEDDTTDQTGDDNQDFPTDKQDDDKQDDDKQDDDNPDDDDTEEESSALPEPIWPTLDPHMPKPASDRPPT